MLKLLKSNQPIATILIPFTVIIIAILDVIFSRQPIQLHETEAWLNASFQIETSIALNYILITANALLINHLFNNHELSDGRNNLSGWFYALLLCSVPLTSPAQPVLFGTLFFIPGLNATLKVYRQNEVAAHYFNAGFLFGLAVLFSHQFLFAPLLLLAAVFYTRAVNWREIFLPILGFALPTLILTTLFWLFERDPFQMTLHPGISARNELPEVYLMLTLLAIAILIGVVYMLRSFGSSSNKSKNSKAVLLLFLPGFVAWFLYQFFDELHNSLALAAIPFALLTPWVFLEKRNRLQLLWFWIVTLTCVAIYIFAGYS